MDMKDLFNGIAVVIDDEVHDKYANINKIVDQIESENIPILKYTTIPSEEVIRHFQNLSFLLFDWRLIKEEVISEMIEEGVTIPDTLQEYDASENIEFIKKLNEVCFCPIFIFTNEDVDSITSKLVSEKIMFADCPSNIFVQRKIDLKGRRKVFNITRKWLEKNPSIYVLKEWEKQYQLSKNKLFSEFQKISPVWPKVLWKNYSEDGINPSSELGELISRNLNTRMIPFNFSEKVLKKRGLKILPQEMQKVLEGEKYLTIDNLHDSDIGTGDLFKEEYLESGETKYRYFLNIRAQCDLLRNSQPDKVELYCLRGRIIDKSLVNKKNGFPMIEGQFLEKVNNAIIPFLDDGKIIEFLFRDIKIIKWKEIKGKRIGRVLSPYLSKIQQRYAHYMQRQGLPRIPIEAIIDK